MDFPDALGIGTPLPTAFPTRRDEAFSPPPHPAVLPTTFEPYAARGVVTTQNVRLKEIHVLCPRIVNSERGFYKRTSQGVTHPSTTLAHSKKGFNTRTSQGVTHPSTTLAQARLTAEF
ncbi:hypothetical protein RJ640_012216 [Escallonia rubra]|uniref:Uncharacterized protein n=1 Tax=Escallonia rubra TaxID=112253 RepID=A0AA88UET9_9ASTE|nr:hypothetical protein RJ640_012216 [Escallonia rubra]